MLIMFVSLKQDVVLITIVNCTEGYYEEKRIHLTSGVGVVLP